MQPEFSSVPDLQRFSFSKIEITLHTSEDPTYWILIVKVKFTNYVQRHWNLYTASFSNIAFSSRVDMDTLRTCHTFIIIFDNLITLVCFIVSSTNLIYPLRLLQWFEKKTKYIQKKTRTVRKNTKRILLPEYTLLFQVSWTREKFLKILEILTTDLLGGDTNTPQDSLSDCGLADDCLKTGNGTIVGILEKLQLKTTDVPETILDEDDPESALYTFVTVVLFGFVSYVFSVIS